MGGRAQINYHFRLIYNPPCSCRHVDGFHHPFYPPHNIVNFKESIHWFIGTMGYGCLNSPQKTVVPFTSFCCFKVT